MRRTGRRDLIQINDVPVPDPVINALRHKVGLTYNASESEAIPLGTYKICGAFGPTWYGEKHLFGPVTTYFKLVQTDGKNEEFTFRRTGNEAKGYVARLIKQVAGNLETPEIQADDF
jgi:hypothetical protein